MLLKQLLYGIASFVPGVVGRCSKGTGGSDDARYCYSVWLRHMVMANHSNLNTSPEIVAEIGPGDSLGVGLAALISGCDKYIALDVVEHANIDSNLKVFEELVALFRNRTDIPGEEEYPAIKPLLSSYEFPAAIYDEIRLAAALEGARLDSIRDSILAPQSTTSVIKYRVPWMGGQTNDSERVDLIFSQAVLEHVVDLDATYKSMRSWLKPEGYLSHQIDYKSHGTAHEWNGHLKYSDFLWKLIIGRRPYLLNREPHSTHISILEKEGFKILCEKKFRLESTLTKEELAPRFRCISDDDVTTSGAFIQAIKMF